MHKVQIKKWRQIKSNLVLDTPSFHVARFWFETAPGQLIDDYYLGISHSGVYIAAFTQNKKFILVKQYKAGINTITLEVPAGYMKRGETPLYAAKRELLEETGYRAHTWKKIGIFYGNPTKMRNDFLHFFVAKDCYRVADQKLDQTENIAVLLLHIRDAQRKLHAQKIKAAASDLIVHLAIKNMSAREKADMGRF